MNSKANMSFITSTIPTDLPQNSENGADIRVSILIILIVVSVIILCSCGIVVCYILKQRRKFKDEYYKQSIGTGTENPSFNGTYRRRSTECDDTKRTRDSGAYKSFDAVCVDMCDLEINYVNPKKKKETPIERHSKDSTTSGAYVSFDDIDHSSLEAF